MKPVLSCNGHARNGNTIKKNDKLETILINFVGCETRLMKSVLWPCKDWHQNNREIS